MEHFVIVVKRRGGDVKVVEEKFEVKLPKKRVEELKLSTKVLEDIEREIDRAEEAGLDVSDLRASLESVREQVEKLMRVYVKE